MTFLNVGFFQAHDEAPIAHRFTLFTQFRRLACGGKVVPWPVTSEKIPSAKAWNEGWDSISDEKGGGQSHTKRVRSKLRKEPDRFLKILRHQNDRLRRRRMFREVAAYRTLGHPAIPKIVDTNVEEYEDLEYKLYLVTELIEGPTLEGIVEDKGPLPPDIGIPLVIRLLDIVEFCHNNDTVHRDIKPDNVILKDCDTAQVVLVDFGLSFNKDDPPQSGTPSDEELGNRFLRLPELSASSRVKQDPRSDVTFCAGILLYAVTGKIPALLLDEEGKMPHQREVIREVLNIAVPPELLSRLLLIFDRGFQPTLSQRWQSADELRKELKLLLKPLRNGGDSYDALRDRVRAYSGRIRAGLAEAMRQDSLKKTICFAPLVVARWAYVLGRPFVVVSDHPVPVDSRISRLFEKMRGIDPHMAIQEANEVRRKFGRQELNMSDFDAWAWQSGE